MCRHESQLILQVKPLTPLCPGVTWVGHHRHPPHRGTLHERSESEYIGQHFANDWTLRFWKSQQSVFLKCGGVGVGRGILTVKLSLLNTGRGFFCELCFWPHRPVRARFHVHFSVP